MTTITALPPAPSRSDPDTFSSKSDVLLGALDQFVTETNTVVTEVNALAAAMGSLASGAATSIPYTFSTTTADADPGAGLLRLDNATQNAATTIRADLVGSDGSTWTDLLATFDDSTSTIKGFIMLQKASDATKWLLFSVSALASPSGYKNITVANVASSAASPFADADALLLKFQRNGDKGDTGATGAQGAAGADGADGISPNIVVSARTSNTILGVSDFCKLIDITSGTFTQTFTAAATLGSGWWCYIRNSGTGNITLDPNSSETIDGVTTGIVTPGLCILIVCTGTAFTAQRIGPTTTMEVLASGTSWTCPIGVRRACVEGVGGGGSGGKAPGTGLGGGGAGGGYFKKVFSVTPGTAYSYAIGAAGATQTSAGTNGNDGGATTFTASVTCTGNGGKGGISTPNTWAAGGTATNGDLNIQGGSGIASGTAPYSTFCGGTPFSSMNISNDPVGSGYGGGGGGATSSQNSQPGQPGVIVLEY